MHERIGVSGRIACPHVGATSPGLPDPKRTSTTMGST
jgi:hypothetical protein